MINDPWTVPEALLEQQQQHQASSSLSICVVAAAAFEDDFQPSINPIPSFLSGEIELQEARLPDSKEYLETLGECIF